MFTGSPFLSLPTISALSESLAKAAKGNETFPAIALALSKLT